MTSGEGGMVASRNYVTAQKLRLLRTQGMERPFDKEILGFNNRMTDVHAAIGRVQLRKLRHFTARRVANATYLSRQLGWVQTPQDSWDVTHVYH